MMRTQTLPSPHTSRRGKICLPDGADGSFYADSRGDQSRRGIPLPRICLRFLALMVLCNLILVILIFVIVSNNFNHQSPFGHITPQETALFSTSSNDGSNCNRDFHQYDFRLQEGCFIHPKHHRPHCQFSNLQIDLKRVSSVRLGGESLTSKNSTDIIGQPEEYEVLKYQPQAFVFSSPIVPSLDDDGPEAQLMQSFPPSLHYINDILKNSVVRAPALSSCPSTDDIQTLDGLTVLIARESYANFYHSMQIWWNAFYTINPSPSGDSQDVKRVIYLDAHPATPLDSFWGDVFDLNVTYLRRDYRQNNMLCLEHVRMIPSSPNAPFSIGGEAGPLFLKHCPAPGMMSRFTSHVLDKYELTIVKQIPGRIVLIDRQPYLAHPRSDTRTMNRQMDGLTAAVEEEIARLETRQTRGVQPSLRIVALETLSIKEQIETIRQAQFLVGSHGAGLTHLLFLNKDAHVLEIGCYKLFYKRLVDWSSDLKLSHHCLKSPSHTTKHDDKSPPLSAYVNSEVIPIIHQVLS